MDSGYISVNINPISIGEIPTKYFPGCCVLVLNPEVYLYRRTDMGAQKLSANFLDQIQ